MPLIEFFVILPDLPTADRSLVRPLHLARAVPMVQRGEFFRFGGAYMAHHLPNADSYTDDRNVPFRGSAMVVMGESEEDVRRKLAEDPYVTGGVWDLEKARIWPFKTVISEPYPPKAPAAAAAAEVVKSDVSVEK